MPKRPNKKPPREDANKAAKAVADRVAALTEDDASNSESQDKGSARSHNSDKVSESERS